MQTEQISFEEAIRRAVNCISQQRLRDAQGLLQAILAQAPQHPDALHLSGIIEQMQGRYDRAIALIELAREAAPEHPLFARNIAEIYRQSGQTDRAIQTGEIAARLDPDCPVALSNLGIAHYDNADYARAKTLQIRALALMPGFAQALNNLASAHRKTGDTERAISLYREAVQSDPDHVESACNLSSVLVDEERYEEALTLLHPLVARHPAHAETHKNIGRAHLGEARLDLAEQSFREAIRLDPRNHEAHLGLSQVLIDKNWPDLGLEQALIAQQLAPDAAAVHHQLGVCQSAAGNDPAALSSFETALACDPDFLNSILALGYRALEFGDFGAARRRFDHAAALKPDDLSPPLATVRLGKITADDPDFAKLRAGLERPLSNATAAALHYGLGKCYDDLGDYDRAFGHFAKGAAAKRSLIQYDPLESDRMFSAIKSTLTADAIAELRGSAISSIAPIFVLGMPRSGSTLIESILGMHSKAVPAGELNYLPKLFPLSAGPGQFRYPEGLAGMDAEDLRSRAATYAEQTLKVCADGRRVIDKLPANFHHLGLIYALFPKATIIHTQRHPLDTCLSCFTHLFERGQLFSYDLVELGHTYRCYADLMQHWKTVLPAQAFYTLEYEKLVDRPEETARDVLQFAGLNWEETCLRFHRSKRPVRTASVSQVREPIYVKSVARWKVYQKHLDSLILALGNDLARR